MKAFVAIVLLGLISSSLAFYHVKKTPVTIIDTSFLKDANTPKKHTFKGLTTLFQQLRDTSQVETFLDGLLDDLANIREQKLAIITQTRANCADEEAFRNEAISEGQNAAAASQAQIDLCTAQQNQANHLNELASSALQVYQNDLEELNAARQEQINVYNTKLAKLNNALDAISQLQALIDQYEAEGNSPLDGSLFLQTTNKLLRHSVSTGHSHLVLPVFTKLLKMHARQTVDEDDLDQIRQLLDNLTTNAQNSVQQINDQEASDEQAFNDASDRLNGLINRLTNQVQVTAAFSATMDQCLAQENSILALSNDKVSRNTDLLDAAEQLCQTAEDEWNQSEVNRAREVNIINALKTAVNKFESDYSDSEGPQVGDLISLKML